MGKLSARMNPKAQSSELFEKHYAWVYHLRQVSITVRVLWFFCVLFWVLLGFFLVEKQPELQRSWATQHTHGRVLDISQASCFHHPFPFISFCCMTEMPFVAGIHLPWRMLCATSSCCTPALANVTLVKIGSHPRSFSFTNIFRSLCWAWQSSTNLHGHRVSE